MQDMHYQAVSLSDMVVAVQSTFRQVVLSSFVNVLPHFLSARFSVSVFLCVCVSPPPFNLIAGLDRHWESHVYCGKTGVSWDLQQPSAAILSAIVQHLSGISSRTAQTRASSAVIATGADESMNHDWALSIGLDPTLTLTSATGNISQFTADAYMRSHVMLMLRAAAELTMQAMVSLAPKIAQMGVYNRDLYDPPCQTLNFVVFVLHLFCNFVCHCLTLIRYENPLLLALVGKHAQFKKFVASSLGALSKLDFPTALQNTHSARTLSIQMAEDASKGALLVRACSCCSVLCGSVALRKR